jgi:hypothetical protein
MTQSSHSTADGVYKDIVLKVVIPAMFIVMTGIIGWLSKIDDRQYSFQKEAVSEAKLTETKREMIQYIDTRFNDMDRMMQVISRQQQQLIEAYNKQKVE